MISRLSHILLFLVGLFGMSQLARQLDPLPFWSWTRSKIVASGREFADCDTVFAGTSRIECGIKTEVFDARMAELGKPTRSVNVALSGILQHDITRILEWMLEHRSPNWKRAVVEVGTWTLPLRPEQWYTEVEIEMHTATLFPRRMITALTANAGVGERLERARFVLEHTLCNVLRIGQGVRMITDHQAQAAGERPPRSWPVQNRGWRSAVGDSAAHVLAGRERFLATRAARYDALAVRDVDAPALREGAFAASELRDLIARFREAGIELILVVMPCWESSFEGRGLLRENVDGTPLLELDVPVGNEDIYDLRHWFDYSHVTPDGAEFLSRTLADRIATGKAAGAAAAPTAAPIELRARWSEGEGRFLELEALNLPTLGTALVNISDKTADFDAGNGFRGGVGNPPMLAPALVRVSTSAAQARVAVPAKPGAPLYLQLMLWRKQQPQGVSAVITVPPRD
jgi:hypothetical protein